MKVAIVTESFLPTYNGVANSVLRVLDTLKDEGHEAMIIAPTTVSSEYLGYKVVKAPSFQIKGFEFGLPMASMAAELSAFAPDVLHAASPVLLGGQALAVAARLEIPSVAIYQTNIADYVERYNFGLIRPAADRIMGGIHATATVNLVPSPDSAKYLRGLGVSNIHQWGRGVDLELFAPKLRLGAEAAELRAKWAPNGERIVGYVGRLSAEKQVERVAELFGVPGVRFVVVGDGPERARLEADFNGHDVIFTGKLSGIELAQAYAAMDIFAHFGTEETFGQTIQEAQASHLAVIAPAVGGPRHLIKHRETGMLVDPSQPLAYRAALEELLSTTGMIARVQEQARRAVLQKSWSAVNQQLLDYYQLAIEIKQGQEAPALAVA